MVVSGGLFLGWVVWFGVETGKSLGCGGGGGDGSFNVCVTVVLDGLRVVVVAGTCGSHSTPIACLPASPSMSFQS